jgi:hypothetical protein
MHAFDAHLVVDDDFVAVENPDPWGEVFRGELLHASEGDDLLFYVKQGVISTKEVL